PTVNGEIVTVIIILVSQSYAGKRDRRRKKRRQPWTGSWLGKRSDAFENPVLQQHFRNLEALALDMIAPEDIEDLIMPKVDQIDQRLGPLAEEFKDLVYPAGYHPEIKPAPKRKTADAGGGAEKKPKVELTQDELKAHFQNGTLGKLTVPVLKEACKQFGIKTTGTKKQDLIDALNSTLAS
ncbi:X-ray repair cross-complementing protein 6, partial [Ilyodon furcidens]